MVLAAGGIGTLATICGIGIAYAMVKVPTVNEDVTTQGATVYWRDGSQMMKIGSSRTIDSLSQISPHMQHAALAAEDRKFYHESAISPTGIARALINDLSGGSEQGGSTITQQYVKNAYLSQQRTISRKVKEICIAIKVGKQEDKDTILQNYLNTIYFGRGANGIEAAARAYFNVPASKLTIQQSAVLAAKIKQPTWYDPGGYDGQSTQQKKQEKADAVARYNFVLDGMRKMGNLTQAQYQQYLNHPAIPIKPKTGNALGGQKGFLYARVVNALHGMKFTDEQIENGGLKVYTTWDKKLQAQAARTVQGDLKAHHMPKDTRVGLVTINPKTGEIYAAYGGADYVKRSVDDAFYATAQVGSSFKPFVLAAALEQGIGLKSQFDPTSPQWFNTQGDSVPPGTPSAMKVVNDEGNTSGTVNLIQAMGKSLNTVYVPVGFKAGSQNVMNLAAKAGLPADKMASQVHYGGFFLGQTDMRPLDLASGYATIANDGVAITPHTITKVVLPGGKVQRPAIEHRTAFSPDVAHDVQYAMQAVVKPGGTAGVNAPIPGRNIAGKTGTTNKNFQAWFSGFTPDQLETTVGIWRYVDSTAKTRKNHTAGYHNLQHVGDYSIVNGGDLPAQIWHDYMTKALERFPVVSFAPPAWVGTTHIYATPSPTPTPTQPNRQKPFCLPNQDPTLDNCLPNGQNNNHGPGSPFCQRHPQAPSCQQSGPTPPSNPGGSCKPPFTLGCTTPPPDGGNGPGGTQPQGTQTRQARPLRE